MVYTSGPLSKLLRTRDLTEKLITDCQVGELWDKFGIIPDVVPFTNDFERANIHELLAPDLLHQLIKGTFQDHLVLWVKEKETHPLNSITIVPAFSGLRHFSEGCGFKQWTGDDLKALMKVYLPAIQGHLPPDIVCAICAFLEFCYIARKNVLTENDLSEHLLLPRQHAMVHYLALIRLFGAPNGLCSSIMESMHIRAIKEPWGYSNCNEALDQMLVTNHHGMLNGTCLGATLEALERRWSLHTAVKNLELTSFPIMVWKFLYNQLYPDSTIPLEDILEDSYPQITGKIFVFNSAIATFYAPSDISGVTGMCCEHIRATSSWRRGAPQYDCVLINSHPDIDGAHGFEITCIFLFFSFEHNHVVYRCALVQWFSFVGVEPDKETGLWKVEPDLQDSGEPHFAIIHIDSIY
ncbi:hypothetical protein BYT27DRAFT_7225445 [Phlegmacium glaucopus]|nr:hypothetical protein BYT27DRAFT_7225445 [Phlegmacium glaucopus]